MNIPCQNESAFFGNLNSLASVVVDHWTQLSLDGMYKCDPNAHGLLIPVIEMRSGLTFVRGQ